MLIDLSHILLVQNHMKWHCFQHASYTGDVGDLHLRLTAKPHICMICDIFNTKVNTSLALCSIHIYWLKDKKSLISYCFCIQVDHFSPCDRSGWHQHPWNLSSAHFYWLQSKMTGSWITCVILIFWRYFICEIGKRVEKCNLIDLKWDLFLFQHCSLRRYLWPPNWCWKKQVSFQINEVVL